MSPRLRSEGHWAFELGSRVCLICGTASRLAARRERTLVDPIGMPALGPIVEVKPLTLMSALPSKADIN